MKLKSKIENIAKMASKMSKQNTLIIDDAFHPEEIQYEYDIDYLKELRESSLTKFVPSNMMLINGYNAKVNEKILGKNMKF